MQTTLATYLQALASGADHRTAVRRAAESVASDPWTVVQAAGRLARARPAPAETDLGLTETLEVVALDHPRAIAQAEQGQPVPRFDRAERRRKGAWDTPASLARTVARATVRAATRTATGLDPACGAGAFLVAMTEAGVGRVTGTDLDPVVLDVARIACPTAQLDVADALEPGPHADVVCGNPPFVRSERQDRRLRTALRRRLPWLRGRFDLVVPFAALATERVNPAGALGLVLPYAVFVQPYAAPLRRRWLEAHALVRVEGPVPFGEAAVKVGWVALTQGRRKATRFPARAALRLPNAPLSPELRARDVALVERMAARSVRLGELCEVDTGLVAHGPKGGKHRLLTDRPGPDTVPFADAREFFMGQHRYLHYRPAEMHRPKRPELFESPKIVVQRLRGRAPVRAAVDRAGVYVGHTCTVVRPLTPDLDLDALVAVVQSELVDAYVRIRCGARLDLYPKDVRDIPVPRAWIDDSSVPLATAYGLSEADVRHLTAVARAT